MDEPSSKPRDEDSKRDSEGLDTDLVAAIADHLAALRENVGNDQFPLILAQINHVFMQRRDAERLVQKPLSIELLQHLEHSESGFTAKFSNLFLEDIVVQMELHRHGMALELEDWNPPSGNPNLNMLGTAEDKY